MQQPFASRYAVLMRVLGTIYAIGAVLFLFFPEGIVQLINVFPAWLAFKVMPVPDGRFWSVLATSMMVMLAILAFLSAAQPSNRGYPMVHLASKLTSSAGFLYQFMNHEKYFAYLVGVITDLPLALIVAWAMVRLSLSKPAAASAGIPAVRDGGAPS